MLGFNTFSVEVIETNRVSLIDYGSLEIAEKKARKLGKQSRDRTVGIIEWDPSLKKLVNEWICIPDRPIVPLESQPTVH